jgi:hypothetical protein
MRDCPGRPRDHNDRAGERDDEGIDPLDLASDLLARWDVEPLRQLLKM